MDPLRIDEIARRLLESVPPGLRSMREDLENNFRAVLRASLSKLDLVARDEFDAQMRVLERTRQRLEELERRLGTLEGTAQSGAAGEIPQPGAPTQSTAASQPGASPQPGAAAQPGTATQPGAPTQPGAAAQPGAQNPASSAGPKSGAH